MSIPQDRADEILATCARCCCVCRRFRPLHLQVHHIVLCSESGSDELDNLIALCLTCHSDVHTRTSFTRRFTVQELKQHRDTVFRLVAEGKLPAGEETDDQVAIISAAIVRSLALLPSAVPPARPELPPEAVEVLLAAVASPLGMLNVVRYSGGMSFLAGTQQFGEPFNGRSSALYRDAVNRLVNAGLLEGGQELLYVTHAGYLVADEVLAAGSQVSSSSLRSPERRSTGERIGGGLQAHGLDVVE